MSQKLITALQNPALYDHPVSRFQLIETHISWVILTGEYAYKIKKPLDFGFLNFSTLDKRRYYCEQELDLNRRSAANIYLEVVPIGGSETEPSFVNKDDDSIFEYAIKMREFAQQQLLDRLLADGKLEIGHIDAAAKSIAAFHGAISADREGGFGTPEKVLFPVMQNFEQIFPFLASDESSDNSPDKNSDNNSQDDFGHDRQQLAYIKAWAADSYNIIEPLLAERKTGGFVRECHGDLHLGNIALLDNKITLFDCIEFNEDFRWTDVIADIAFLVMDLEHRGLQQFANHLVNAYLQYTGDYAGLGLVKFYKSYRAMVRAKVALFGLHNEGLAEEQRRALFERYRSYANLAESYTRLTPRYLLLMHGFSGSGKTTVSSALVRALGAIRLRSDVERKRLLAESSQDLYSHTASDATFAHLADLARAILKAGYPVIIDATSLHKPYRSIFAKLCEEEGIPMKIIDCRLTDAEIRLRLQQRQQSGTDASDATVDVYQKQLQTADPLDTLELSHSLAVDTGSQRNIDDFIETVAQHMRNNGFL